MEVLTPVGGRISEAKPIPPTTGLIIMELALNRALPCLILLLAYGQKSALAPLMLRSGKEKVCSKAPASLIRSFFVSCYV